MTLRARFIADDAISVEEVSGPQRDALAKRLTDMDLWQEVIPGRTSVTTLFDPLTLSPEQALARVQTLLAIPLGQDIEDKGVLDLPICYDRAFALDLDHLAERTSLGSGDLIARHAASNFCVDMMGFTPGFAYVDGLDPQLDVPRLATPRARLAAGSVGIAGGQMGLYALPGPGGWPIIGRTPLTLFTPERTPPFLLHAGLRLRIRPITLHAFENWGSA